MNKAIILAGGTGSRFLSKTPKQFSNFDGTMLIHYTIEACIFSRNVESILIVCHKDFIEIMNERINNSDVLKKKDIKVIAGGESRTESTVIGFLAVDVQAEDTIILLESNRPFVRAEDIDKIYSDFCEKKTECAFYFSRMNESLFCVKNKGEALWLNKAEHGLSQTPYILSYVAIQEILQHMKNKIYSDYEDILSFLPPLMKKNSIESHFYNIKITYPEDIAFGECLMKRNGK